MRWPRRKSNDGLRELRGKEARRFDESRRRYWSPDRRAVGKPRTWGHYLVKMKDGSEQYMPCITQEWELDGEHWSESFGPSVGPANSGTMLQFTYGQGRPNVLIPLSNIDYYLHKSEPPPGSTS